MTGAGALLVRGVQDDGLSGQQVGGGPAEMSRCPGRWPVRTCSTWTACLGMPRPPMGQHLDHPADLIWSPRPAAVLAATCTTTRPGERRRPCPGRGHRRCTGAGQRRPGGHRLDGDRCRSRSPHRRIHDIAGPAAPGPTPVGCLGPPPCRGYDLVVVAFWPGGVLSFTDVLTGGALRRRSGPAELGGEPVQDRVGVGRICWSVWTTG